MRDITHLVVHCTGTREGQDFDISDVRKWHIARGWSAVGYHFVIKLDGTIQKGREETEIGAHVAGHNATTIGISYVGGCDKAGKPKDTRTAAQKQSLESLLRQLKRKYPKAQILGHRDFQGVNKACPSFDAIPAYKHL